MCGRSSIHLQKIFFLRSILSGTLYVGAVHAEVSPWYALVGKIDRLKAFNFVQPDAAIVATTSTASLSLHDASIDYIFTDPPFGSNIIYSDLSILWESWLRLSTNTAQESVVHRRKKKGAFTLEDYTGLMSACFQKMYGALKPGHWITVEFHNSKNSVWNAIQEALLRAGFVVADVRTLDKQVGTFKQVNAAGAVKQDLVISAYKPTEQLEKRFSLIAGTEEGVWDFVADHLKQLTSHCYDSQPGRSHCRTAEIFTLRSYGGLPRSTWCHCAPVGCRVLPGTGPAFFRA